MNEQALAQKAAQWALNKVGCIYSQERRTQENVFDCSSLVARAYSAQGKCWKYGGSVPRSNQEVYDDDFELLWPADYASIGKQLGGMAAISTGKRAGDLQFLCTDSKTSRANRITHVAMVASASQIVHARGKAYQAVVYSEPVHFRESENGDWQEIDNTLEEAVNAQGRAVLRNRANRMHVEFPQRMDGGSMATITDGGKVFSWRFEQDAQPIQAKVRTGAELKQERLVKQAQKMAKFVGRTIDSLKNADLSAEIETEQERRGDIARLKAENTYEEVLPGVSVRYTLRSKTVKEDIILANAEALSRTAIRLPKQYDYAVDEGKKLLVKDKATGSVVFTMATPFVYDAAGKETIADVVLTDCGEYVRMEYVLDAAFMTEAQFPVTIDPVVSSTNPVHNIQDTTLGEGQSAKPYTADHLKIGKYNGSVRCVGLLKFNHLAVMPASDTVVGAVLQIRTKSSSTSNYIAAYRLQ